MRARLERFTPSCSDTEHNQRMNQPPVYREVNRYVLFERIGSGGMSTVWRARRKDDATDLAIKVIPIEDLNPDFERRLRREPEIHQQLLHESIVPLIDW